MNPFAEKGYLIFPKVVPDDLLAEVRIDVLEHTGCKGEAVEAGGMVEMYHYQSMWNVRQHHDVHTAFAGIFGTERLWVSVDRVSYKFVVDPEATEEFVVGKEHLYVPGGFIHWDINVNQRPRPFEVQGVIALGDTDADMGGFQCVPDLYRELDEWMASLPTKKAIFPYFRVDGDEAVETVPLDWPWGKPRRWKIEQVPMRAGDLLVYDSFLPHGNGVNRGKRSRFAQYVTMFPPGDERLRRERVECWRTNSPPSGWAFPGDHRGIEQKWGRPALLSDLGKKLLGLKEW